MKLFLTGSTGFVGFTILLESLRNPLIDHLTASVRNPSKLLSLLASEGFPSPPPKLSIIQGDTSQWNLPSSDFSPTACIHCAGTLFSHDPAAYFRDNVDGTLNLLAQLPPSCQTILLSSQSAAGPSPSFSQPLHENDPCAPISFYGKSKYQMELAVGKKFASSRPILVLRPPIILGPRDSASLPLFRMAKSPVCFKPGSQEKTLSWISVNDLVSALFTALRKDSPSSGTYFVAATDPTTDSTLIREAAQTLGKNPVILPIPKLLLKSIARLSSLFPAIGKSVPSLTPDRCQELFHDAWVVSPSRFQNDFSWQASESLPTTLRQTCDSYLRRNLL